MSRTVRSAVATVVALSSWVASAQAAASPHPAAPVRSAQPPVLSPRFRYVANYAPFLWTGTRFALTWNLSGPSPPATLIDDQTGRRTTIRRPGCHPQGGPGVGERDLPWIMFLCSPATQNPPAWELYSPGTGRWLSVSPSPGVMCGGQCGWGLLAAGRYWLEFQQSTCPNGNYHECSATNVFQSIQTGQVRGDPSGPTTLVDLDAPDLTRAVCSPLSAGGGGSLSFYGSFALSSVAINTYESRVYLERCGTRLHRRVGAETLSGAGPMAVDAHEVVWMGRPGQVLTGLTLPGLQRFTIRLPRRLLGSSCASQDDFADCLGGVALTDRRLYIVTATYPEHLWAAPVPLPAERRSAPHGPLGVNGATRT